MSWYSRIILAQGAEQYLRSLGADEDIIQYILSQGDNAQFLVNEFRKNPGLNRFDIEAFQFPEKEVVDPYLPVERRKATSKPDIEEWVLVNYRRLRQGKVPPGNNMSLINDILGLDQSIRYWTFDAKIDEIDDWNRAILPDIASYSAEQAIVASDEWHKMIIAEGEGKYYEPTKPENIVHGPKWKFDPDWQGWTIQKITSRNDMLAEGNKVRHCVGEYWNSVAAGDINIYSLRDPSNKPYATIETSSDDTTVNQIKGLKNTVPDTEYRDMISDWIENNSKSPYQWTQKETSLFDISGSFANILQGLEDLDNGYIGDIDDYDYDHDGYSHDYGLDPPGDPEFEEWSNNFDIIKLMDNIFEAMEDEYMDDDPDKINWYEEPIVNALINKAKQEDKNYSRKHGSDLVREKMKGVAAEGEQVLRSNADKYVWHQELVEASFARHVLEKISMPEGQMSFDFHTGSSWYNKIVLAQGLEPFLRTLTEDEDVIQYIMSQGENSQYYVNEFKKNPTMTREQLESFQFPQKEVVDPYTEHEKKSSQGYPEPVRTWLLVNLRKMRMAKESAPENERARLHNTYMCFIHQMPETLDWWQFSDPTPQIEQFSPEEAIAAQEEWHRIAAGKGKGVEYEPTKTESIMYGPQWQNPDWEGWTVQKVTSENDVLAEGSEAKMDHCVGEYCDDIEAGLRIIYSLRDPRNRPHITMETDDFGNISQIQGKSNHEPKPEYKAMMREWLSTTGEKAGIVTEINTFEDVEGNSYGGGGANIVDYNDAMERIIQGDQNEYGLTYILDTTMDVIADSISDRADRSYSYNEGIDDSPAYLVNLAMKEDLKKEHWPRHAGEWKEFRESPKKSDWKNIREIRKWAWEQINVLQEEASYFPEEYLEQPMPEEENYKDPMEYQVAMKIYEGMLTDIENEWLNSLSKGRLSKSIVDEIDDYVKEGMIPNPQELYAIDQKEEKEKQRKAEETLKSNPAYQDAYDRGQQMLGDRERQGSSNWYKKALEK